MRKPTTFRLDTEEIQGPGSFVVVKKLTWGEWKAIPTGALIGDVIAARVIEWNWTDEHGEPLPLPGTGDAGAILLQEEVDYLAQAITRHDRDEDEAKN